MTETPLELARRLVGLLEAQPPVEPSGVYEVYVKCDHCGWRMYARPEAVTSSSEAVTSSEVALLEHEHTKHYNRFHGRFAVAPSPWPDGRRPEVS